MRVVIVSAPAGVRGGADWPAPGTPIEVPDAVAVCLLNAGVAEAVEAKPRHTTRVGSPCTSQLVNGPPVPVT